MILSYDHRTSPQKNSQIIQVNASSKENLPEPIANVNFLAIILKPGVITASEHDLQLCVPSAFDVVMIILDIYF